jgi:hypothetical protein
LKILYRYPAKVQRLVPTSLPTSVIVRNETAFLTPMQEKRRSSDLPCHYLCMIFHIINRKCRPKVQYYLDRLP